MFKTLLFIACIFDKCELINGLFLGVISSFIAAGLIYLFENFKKKKKYGKAVGEYLGFGYKKTDSDLTLNEIPQSKAIISYLKDNQLNIELTDLASPINYRWTGTIFMELENYGSIAWKYDIYAGNLIGGNTHKFGFKKIIINEVEGSLYIYMLAENLGSCEIYENEVFKRVKK